MWGIMFDLYLGVRERDDRWRNRWVAGGAVQRQWQQFTALIQWVASLSTALAIPRDATIASAALC